MMDDDAILFLHFSSKLFKEIQDQQVIDRQNAEKVRQQRHAMMSARNRR